MKNTKLHLYSIVRPDLAHMDEICGDIKQQYENGVATCALFSMTLSPEGSTPLVRVRRMCETYKQFRQKLTGMGLKCGVLIQASIGHGRAFDVRDEGFPYQKYVAVSDGKPRYVACPYGTDFQNYIYETARLIAQCGADAFMVDDDFRMIARDGRGCVCPLHLKKFNELAGTDWTEEQLRAYIYSDDHGETEYTKIFEYIQKESLVESAKAIRAGFDSVDPKIQGSYTCVDQEMQFAPEIAKILAGEGNPTIVRIGNGYYTAEGARGIVNSFYRAAMQAEKLKDKVDILQAETDTCPHNRYSTGAMTLHSHFTGSLLEGVRGAKQWITRLAAYEPESGKAYRKGLGKYRGFYEAIAELVPELKWRGCRIPVAKEARLTTGSNWGYQIDKNCGWSRCVLDRYGLPMYFSSDNGGVLCLEGDADIVLTDAQLMEAFRGPVMVASNTARRLIDRGFGAYLGVDVQEITGSSPSGDIVSVNGNNAGVQQQCKKLVPLSDDVIEDSTVIHVDSKLEKKKLFPGTTVYKNDLGGTSIVFSGTPEAKFHYSQFSFLNYSRKQQIIRLLDMVGQLPVYYPHDEEVYMKVADMPGGGYFCAMFNIGFDPIEDVQLMCKEPVSEVQMLMPDGSRKALEFQYENGKCTIGVSCVTLQPLVLFIK